MEAKDADFVGALILYQYRQDNALGLHHLTTKQRGLIWYYNLLRLNVHKELIHSAMAKGAMNQIRNQIKRIMREAKKRSTPLERKRQLLIEAMQLEEMASKWQT